jgi:RNA polymerase sigma factor (sigma-70 family)
VVTGGDAPVDREAAFVAFFDAYYGKILAYARRRLDSQMASDVVADTFVTAWLRLDDLRGDPLVWLYGLARGSVANHRRRLLRSQHLGERADRLTAIPDQGDPADAVAWRDSFAAAFVQLSEPDREELRLVAWEGLDAAAGATVLGCSTGAFKVRLHRARGRLRRYLSLDAGANRSMGTVDPAISPRANTAATERQACSPSSPRSSHAHEMVGR